MRRARFWVVLVLVLVVLAGTFLLVLPSLVRRVAISRIQALTGRPVTVGAVHVNVFTRRIVFDDLAIADPPRAPVAEFKQFAARYRMLNLLRGRLYLDTAALVSPTLRIVRLAPDRLNVSDVIQHMAASTGGALNVTLARFDLRDGSVAVEDRTTTPPNRWEAAGLTVELHDIATRADTERGTATATFTLAGAPGTLTADRIRVHPAHARAQLAVAGLDLAQFWTYLPPGSAVRPQRGHFTTRLAVEYAEDTGLHAGGEATMTGLVLLRQGEAAPFVSTPAVAMTARDVVYRGGLLQAGHLEVSTSPTVAAGGGRPERYDLHDVHLTVEQARYPGGPPGRLRLTAGLPSGATLDAHGTVAFAPMAADVDVTLAALDLGLLAPYVPPVSPINVREGRLDARLAVRYAAATGARVSGDFATARLMLMRRGQSQPFVTHPLLRGHVTDLALAGGSITVRRLSLSGAPSILDASVSPPQRFDFRRLTMVAEDAAWPAARPARVEVHATVADGGTATIRGTMTPATMAASVRATLAGLDVARLAPYLPPTTPIALAGGRMGARLALGYDQRAGARVNGDITVANVALAQRGQPQPFLTDPALTLHLKDLVLRNGVVSATAVALSGRPTLADTSTKPPRSVAFRAFRLALADVAWPAKRPARLDVTADLPEAGSLHGQGDVAPDGSRVDLALDVRDAALGPLRAFLPVDTRIDGRADAGLDVHATLSPALAIGATGTATVRKLALGRSARPAVSVERLEAVDLDVRWPTRVQLGRVTVANPYVIVEREQDGSFPLRGMLAPILGGSTPSTPTPSSPTPPAAAGGPAATPGPERVVEMRELAIKDGDVRFIDHSTSPFYSEELSHLTVALRDFSTAPGARSALQLQGVVGTSGALDLQGQVAVTRPFYVDVSGQLRDFAVSSTNPYLSKLLDWIARDGSLTTKVHYHVDGDQLEASNDIDVQRLSVERAGPGDKADKSLGLPLGLVVALLKNSHGDIHLSVPVSGKLSSPQFSFGDAIATAARHIVTHLVTAPFSLIGRAFQRDGKVEALHVAPVDFKAGSAVLTPDAERQVQRVADFLRASPFVKLVLHPIVTAEDETALKTQAVLAKIQRARSQYGTDFAHAAGYVYSARFPGRTPPEKTDEIVAALRDAEPSPTDAAHRLATRRIEATRQALVRTAGIQGQQIEVGQVAGAPGASGTGRVEFTLAS